MMDGFGAAAGLFSDGGDLGQAPGRAHDEGLTDVLDVLSEDEGALEVAVDGV